MNRDQILKGIDNMKNLREKDYDTLDFLLKNTSPRLFTKIIEEILLGNLYISDFESLLSDSQRERYNAIIQQECELVDYISKLTAFREKIYTETQNYGIHKADKIIEAGDYTDEQKKEIYEDNKEKYDIPVYISNEIYNADKDYKSFIKDIEDPVITSISIKSLDKAVGGVLRRGDRVDISLITDDSGSKSLLLSNVYIIEAMNSSGEKLTKDKKEAATIFNIIVNKDDAQMLKEVVNSNKDLTLVKTNNVQY